MYKANTLIKRIFKVAVILIFGFCIPLKVLNFALVDDVRSYTRVMLHEMYTQEENIDVLFIGSSHCYRTLNPGLIDNIWSKNTFNGGTSSQSLDGSYAILNEVAKNNDLETVYLEMFYVQMGGGYSNRTQLTSTYIIYDYLKPSINKYSYLLNAAPKENYIESFILARRNWKRIFEKGYINNLIEKKLSEEYKSYQYIDNGIEEYLGKGYVANYDSIEGGYISDGDFSPTRALSEDDIKYIKKIKALCDKKGIRLVLFSAPMPDFRVCATGNYDSYVNELNQLASDLDFEYFDFNLCKSEFLSLAETDFYDDQHLNHLGADKFSRSFAKFFLENNYSACMYESYAEKLNYMEDIPLGVIVSKEEADLKFETVIPREMTLYYEAQVEAENDVRLYKGNGGSFSLPIDLDKNNKINISLYYGENDQSLCTKYAYEVGGK